MKKTLKHKGYLGSIDVSFEDDCLYGEVLYINDKIIFEGKTPEELGQQFVCAVDDYIELCDELGREPQKPFSGSFNVRIPATLHKQAVEYACTCGIKLNEFVKQAISDKVDSNSVSTVHHVHHMQKYEQSFEVNISQDEYAAEPFLWNTEPPHFQ